MPAHHHSSAPDDDVIDAEVQVDPDAETGETVEEKAAVREEIARMRAFAKELSFDDIKQGTWFTKLLTFSLAKYVTQVNADYFRGKYPHLPTDAMVEARIRMASRYAGIEGGLNATAASGAVLATATSGGTASPLALPAGITSFVVDMAYTTQIQLRLAYDIAVLYGVPLNLDDPEDLWRLIRIAFVVKSGEMGTNAAMKAVPAFLRPAVKRIFSGATLAAVKELPVVGKYLLQRNIVKFSVPGVSIPLSVAMNTWMTRTAGAHARHVFREEARIIEAAGRLTARTTNHEALLWVMWLVMQANKHTSDQETRLLHHVARLASEQSDLTETLEALRSVVEVDSDMVLSLLSPDDPGAGVLHEAAILSAAVNGKATDDEMAWLQRIAEACGREHDPAAAKASAKSWR